MVYVDTSVLVSILTNEPDAPKAMAWLKRQAPGTLSMSHWTATEFSSALALKVRTGQLEPRQQAMILAAFDKLVTASFNQVSITAGHYIAAARLCDRPDLKLRAGDSLHLAIALEAGSTLVTMDVVLARAGTSGGLPTEFLS